jgi:hypothetical protein
MFVSVGLMDAIISAVKAMCCVGSERGKSCWKNTQFIFEYKHDFF